MDFVDLGDARDDDATRAETPPSAADEDAASEGIATNARGMEAARRDARVIVSRRALPAPAACAVLERHRIVRIMYEISRTQSKIS